MKGIDWISTIRSMYQLPCVFLGLNIVFSVTSLELKIFFFFVYSDSIFLESNKL